MNLFESQFQKIRQSLQFEDYNSTLKRIIDLTIDTEDLSFYKKTYDLLIWTDYNESNLEGKKEKYTALLEELYTFLSKRNISKPTLLIETKDLTKSYSKSIFSLGPISLSIHEGEIIGLVGENGNGKTTLLRSLCGKLKPTNGSIAYHFNYKDKYDLISQLIYIPQRTNIWHGSVLENLYFTGSSYGIKGEENLLIVDLITSRMGLRNYKNLSWKNLSSGYKMRFELARMLLRKPKLLLIDEPLANLDILAQQTVLEDFKAIAKSPFRPLGIVLSSQQLYEVEKTSDQVIFLKNGQQQNLKNPSLNNSENEEKKEFIIEFESGWDQEQIKLNLNKLSPSKIHYNGSTYIVHFPSTISLKDFLQVIIEKGIPIQYLRDISNSTRRFFT